VVPTQYPVASPVLHVGPPPEAATAPSDVQATADRPRPASRVRGGRRADLDGLRAVAVLLVVVYHVWFGRVSGGVDVFLLLSAFFLTGSFARKIAAGRPLAPIAYWARTFKRLVPVSALVLLGVLATVYLLYPPSTWPTVWSQTWASLGYVQNWELAREAVDYYARDGALASPLQHYWSLSVQGQVFLLWPLLLVASGWVVRRFRLPVTPVLLVVFGTVFVVSLVFSVIETTTAQELAYFDTRARLWEFALGSLVAVALPHLRVPRWLGAPLGWAGLLAIVVCGLVIDVQGGFPGYFALWPTLAAAAVIAGGAGAADRGAGRLLSRRVLVRLGRDAYALYLVHWPILVTWRLLTERATPSWLEGLGIVVGSLVLARILTAMVEEPVRTWWWARHRAGRSAVVVAVAASLVVGPLVAWEHVERSRAARAVSGDAEHPGARVLMPGFTADVPTDAELAPAASALDDQWVRLGGDCTGDVRPRDDEIADWCQQWAPDEGATRTVVVVGDSHAQQQALGAFVPIAQDRGWRVVAVLRGGCSFGVGEHLCASWNERVLDFVVGLAPDGVLTISTAAEAGGPAEAVVTGQVAAVARLADAGIPTVGVRDNPRFSRNVFRCVEQHGLTSPRCRADVTNVLAAQNPAEADGTAEFAVDVDLSPMICPDGRCVPVVGNVHVYMDDNHLSGDFARSLSPFLEEQLGDWLR
jgi:peptidoglycan/LPS O-acetylase OafA/YrhL